MFMLNPMFSNKINTRTKVIGSFVFLLLVAGFIVDYSDMGNDELTGAAVTDVDDEEGLSYSSWSILIAVGTLAVIGIMLSFVMWKRQL